MLLARDLAIEDVVEQELGHHRGDHLVDLTPGEVDQHALQPADLTRYVQSHAGGILPSAKKRVRSGKPMRPRGLALLLVLTVSPLLGASSPRVTFERLLPAPHDLGAAEEVALVLTIGDTPKVASFVDHFLHQIDRSGTLRIRDVRARGLAFNANALRRGEPADVYLAVRSFTCANELHGGEEGAHDVDGKRIRLRQVWAEATCTARMEILSASGQRSSYAIKGEGASAHVADITDEERDEALEHAARYAAVRAAEQITPRRVRESIILDETAPAFEEGMAMIDANRLADARQIWETAFRSNPRSAALHYNLAAVSEALGDRKAAEQHYNTARSIAPKEARYSSELKSFMRRVGRTSARP
jgi:hypothetical protein